MITLKESLYDIISPTKEIAEGILNASDIETNVDDDIAERQSEIIRALTGRWSTPVEAKNGTLYIKSDGKSIGPALTTGAELVGCNIEHIVCDDMYSIYEWQIERLVDAGIKSITSPKIKIIGRVEFNGDVLNKIKLVADNFIIEASGDRGKTSTIKNLNLKCKKTIKMFSGQGSWGDELILENVTVDCNKLILVSRQNFNTNFGDLGNRGNWKVRKFADMGLTPVSKFKQIDCLDDQAEPDICIRYSKKKPKDWNDDPNSHERKFYCWEMLDRAGWYCDTKVKPTKAMLKV